MKNKVTIIGAGMVGSTTAYSLVVQDIAEEIALVDVNKKLAKAQVMDLQHAAPFTRNTNIKVGTYSDCKDSGVVVITCGAAQKPGETRLDLISKNTKIIRDIVPQVFKANPKAVILMITNPVDVLTYMAIKMFPNKKNQIIGSGTTLDTARFRHLLSDKLNISTQSIHAYIMGEHGDSEFPVWSSARLGNISLDTYKRLSTKDKEDIFTKAKNAAYAIIAGKQSTYYGIGSAAANIIMSILHDKRMVLPVSHLIENVYGVKDVCLSTPVILGRHGVMGQLPLDLSKEEKASFIKSAKVLKKAIKSVN
ncbi:L-lactate dehydrogenase [Patescibacteria group bacterium]|nr:L-lactate dehydrogenase [Patescibacteria group bacterium]